jgi:hypothetical protein
MYVFVCVERNFRTSFKEHFQTIKANKLNSKFAERILNTLYTYDTIEKIIHKLHVGKGPHIK